MRQINDVQKASKTFESKEMTENVVAKLKEIITAIFHMKRGL